MSQAPTPDLVGRVVLGRYRIVRLLFEGGMGLIYLARSEGAAGFTKPVVVKRLRPSALGGAKMFVREARIMSNLHHPGIVSINDFQQEDDAYLMVLDYVQGYDLSRWHHFVRATRGAFPVELAVQIMSCVLDALHYAHTLIGPDGTALNIVHRDISPGNVLVDVEGHVKITDFGIARMQAQTDEFKTEERMIKGKFHYLAPELFKRAEPSPQTDVYACGVVLHELLSGKNEFREKDIAATVARVLGHNLSRLDLMREDVSPELGGIIAKATAKNPEQRYQSGQEFAQALRATRTISPDEATRRLSEAARRDFYDERMASMVDATDLKVLERAWRDEPQARDSPPPAPKPPPSPLTSAEITGVAKLVAPELIRPRSTSTIADTPPVMPVPRTHPWMWIAAAVLGIGVVGAVAALQRSSANTPTFVYVQEEPVGPTGASGPSGLTGTAASPAEPDAGEADAAAAAVAAVLDAGVAGARPEDPKQGGGGGTIAALTRAFARQRGKVSACFNDHAADIVGLPQVFVRFQVATDGHVITAELIPDSLSPTPLGECLLKTARETEFGKQDKPVTFRIPVTVKRGVDPG